MRVLACWSTPSAAWLSDGVAALGPELTGIRESAERAAEATASTEVPAASSSAGVDVSACSTSARVRWSGVISG